MVPKAFRASPLARPEFAIARVHGVPAQNNVLVLTET